jgi:hypothetical protein
VSEVTTLFSAAYRWGGVDVTTKRGITAELDRLEDRLEAADQALRRSYKEGGVMARLRDFEKALDARNAELVRLGIVKPQKPEGEQP